MEHPCFSLARRATSRFFSPRDRRPARVYPQRLLPSLPSLHDSVLFWQATAIPHVLLPSTAAAAAAAAATAAGSADPHCQAARNQCPREAWRRGLSRGPVDGGEGPPDLDPASPASIRPRSVQDRRGGPPGLDPAKSGAEENRLASIQPAQPRSVHGRRGEGSSGLDPANGCAEESRLASIRPRAVDPTTSSSRLAVLVGCGGACAAAAPPPHPLAAKPKDEPDPGDGRQRVTVFFSRQTSTAEGFTKDVTGSGDVTARIWEICKFRQLVKSHSMMIERNY
ncbi:uncharacterized protein [Miscanthus floridulus]|uniref:uncharacterized protein n=1 Tax=Miscanthus floridulus TaxID=154761 RepID=UPI003458B6E6